MAFLTHISKVSIISKTMHVYASQCRYTPAQPYTETRFSQFSETKLNLISKLTHSDNLACDWDSPFTLSGMFGCEFVSDSDKCLPNVLDSCDLPKS